MCAYISSIYIYIHTYCILYTTYTYIHTYNYLYVYIYIHTYDICNYNAIYNDHIIAYPTCVGGRPS